MNDSIPFFSGHWCGTRNDWAGDVGISFVAETNCVVTALGRHADNGALLETATVTLWSVDTATCLAAVDVGPFSAVEGHYAFDPLTAGVVVHVGREYRVSQQCWVKMRDKWFDGQASLEDVTTRTASSYAQFVGGVCRNDDGFPNREDGEYRRAGIVNFKIGLKGLEVVPVTREELAHSLARIATAEEHHNPEAAGTYIAVLASLLGLLVDDLGDTPGAAAFIVVAPDDELHGLVRFEPVDGEFALSKELAGINGEGVGCTVFEDRFANGLIGLARRRRGRLDDHGGPMDGGFVVSHDSGRILAAATQIFRRWRLMGAADMAALLGRGMVLTRSVDGSVTAFPAVEARRGRALRIRSPGSPERLGVYTL